MMKRNTRSLRMVDSSGIFWLAAIFVFIGVSIPCESQATAPTGRGVSPLPQHVTESTRLLQDGGLDATVVGLFFVSPVAGDDSSSSSSRIAGGALSSRATTGGSSSSTTVSAVEAELVDTLERDDQVTGEVLR